MKKKGLIISTIVMVVVLIASLTTATYAWFSSTATAKVTDLSIKTSAADGLQIAMVNGTTASRVSGNLEYNGSWTGSVDDWGSELNFSTVSTQVGTITDAVTRIASGTSVSSITLPNPVTGYKAVAAVNTASPNAEGVSYYLATAVTLNELADFQYGVHYGVDGEAELSTLATTIVADKVINKVETRPTDYSSSKTYVVYTVAPTAETAAQEGAFYCVPVTTTWATFLSSYVSEGNLTQDIYLVPTGYDAAVNPTGYEIASANSEFYHLTMAVTNMKDTGDIGFSLAVVPSGKASVGTVSKTNPGMASALRMIVNTAKVTSSENAARTGDKTVTCYPFSAYKLNKSTGRMAVGTADSGEYNSTLESHGSSVAGTTLGNYAFMIDDSSTIAAGSVYYVDIIIWVEGTDNECHNQTAGTEMKFYIDFGYAAAAADIDWLGGNFWSAVPAANKPAAADDYIIVSSLKQAYSA